MKIYIVTTLLLMSSWWIQADLIYSNHDGTASSSAVSVDYFSNSGTRWSTFGGIAPSGTWSLSSVELNLHLLSGSSDDITVSLYTGTAQPVLFVAELTADAPVTSTQAFYTFSPSSPVFLQGGTDYQIVLEPDFVDGTWVAWHHSPTSNGARNSEASGTTWGAWEVAFVEAPTVRIFADAVPEPSTTILMFIAGLGCWMRRLRLRMIKD